MTTDTPLVSIIVITYNSAKFVLETLDSAKAQTYQNIELIISDDGSTDDTVAICQQWLTANAKRFVRTELLTVEKNTGIPANCNRGVKASRGEWLKFIAGDDILLDYCILENIKRTQNDLSVKVLQSDLIAFDETAKVVSILKPLWFPLHLETAKEQFKFLVKKYCGNTPTLFFHHSIFLSIEFDENIKIMEDYPILLKLTDNGIYIDYMEKETVRYRISSNSVSGINDKVIFKSNFREILKFDKSYRYPYLHAYNRRFEKIEGIKLKLLYFLRLNKASRFNWLLFKLGSYINPYFHLKK